jgi:hypothetical protein
MMIYLNEFSGGGEATEGRELPLAI